MHAEQAQVGILGRGLGGFQEIPELPTNLAIEGETRDRDPLVTEFVAGRTGSVEDVDQRMVGHQGPWQMGTFVVSRHHDHWHPAFGHCAQRLESSGHQAGGHPAAKQEVAPVHHEINLTS